LIKVLGIAGLLFVIGVCLAHSLHAQQAGPESVETLYTSAEKALAERRYDAATQNYEKAARLAPEVAEIHAKLGLVYYEMGRFAQAAEAFKRAIKLKPDLPNAQTLLAISISELGRYTEAIPFLEKGFSGASDANLKRLAGLELIRSLAAIGKEQEAARVALQLNRLYADDPEVLYHTGKLFGDLSYLTMRRLGTLAPNSIWAHHAIAEARMSEGNYPLAIIELRTILAMDANRPGIHQRLGRALMAASAENSAGDEALKEFLEELRLDPTSASAAYEAGELYRKKGETERARDYFEQALKHYPDFEGARIGLARVLLDLHEPGKALVQLREATRLNPKNEVTHYQMSMAYRALGDRARQQSELEEFQRLRNDKKRNQTTPLPIDRTTAPTEQTLSTAQQ